MTAPALRVVNVGCGHGSLNQIYDDIARASAERGWSNVDLVIVGGDFQALRNVDDAACLSVPSKYRQMGDYHEYYSGRRVAPYLTIFCGGNHEASNHLFELYYGGWVAHNIYYLGAAGVVNCGPLRIAGMSGIWKPYDYRKPHYERIPYRAEDLHSVFHVRELDVRKLLQIRTQIDIGLSHDWPRHIENFGDHKRLFRKKRGFEEDSRHGKLGNLAAREVLNRLRPAYWFSAHLHVEFAAAVPHDNVAIKRIGLNQDLPAAWGVEVAEPVDGLESKPSIPDEKSAENLPPKSDTGSSQITAAHGNEADRIAAWGGFQETDNKTREQQFLDMVHRMNMQHPATQVDVTWKQASSGKFAVEHDSLVYANKRVKNDDEIDLDSDSDSAQGPANESVMPSAAEPSWSSAVPVPFSTAEQGDLHLTSGGDSSRLPAGMDGASDELSVNQDGGMSLVDQAFTDSLRSKLPAAFARPVERIQRPKRTPVEIKNKLTRFLALDKPNNHDAYFKLLEIAPISDNTMDANSRQPHRLMYDKEWLAITRVFAQDLVLGDQTSKVAADLGEDAYQVRIKEEEVWVEENVVKKDLMSVPYNFNRSAPRYTPGGDIQHPQMPMEFPNLQTAEFCELLQIENKFFLDEQQRSANYESLPAGMMANSEGADRRRGSGRRGRGRRGRR